MSDRELVERLGGLEVGDRVRVTAEDETFEGQANPIDYVSEESLRVEIRPGDGNDRYEINAEYDDGWSEPKVRHTPGNGPDADWEKLGTVDAVEPADGGANRE